MAKRKNPKAPAAVRPELPPNTPSSRAQLERAIVLLGNRANGLDLSQKSRAELVGLVGGYPKPATASNWKLALKQVRDDEIFDRVG
jgi:hypothetical protein